MSDSVKADSEFCEYRHFLAAEPKRMAALLNYTLAPNGQTYASEDPEKLPERIIHVVNVLARAELQKLPLREAIRASDELRPTRPAELVIRFNTVSQAKFYVEHQGADFSDYLREDETYRRALTEAQSALSQVGRCRSWIADSCLTSSSRRMTRWSRWDRTDWIETSWLRSTKRLLAEHANTWKANLPHHHAARVERMKLSLDGLGLGDALGEMLCYQAHAAPRRLAESNLPAGPWFHTDDTEMAISIVAVLKSHGLIQQDALAKRFARRFERDPDRGYGKMTRIQSPRKIGIRPTTGASPRAFLQERVRANRVERLASDVVAGALRTEHKGRGVGRVA